MSDLYIPDLSKDGFAEFVQGVGGNFTHIKNNKANKIQESWQPLVLQNEWTQLEQCVYRKTEFGELQLRGRLQSGVTTPGTVLFTLPAGYRVPFNLFVPNFSGYGSNGKMIYLRFQRTGEVQLFAEEPMRYLDINNITIPL